MLVIAILQQHALDRLITGILHFQVVDQNIDIDAADMIKDPGFSHVKVFEGKVIYKIVEEYVLWKDEQKRRAECLEFRIFERLYKEHRIWYDAVMQVYCFGKSQQEAADQLGIAVEVLNSRLYRARQWIRKNYEKEYEEVVNWF